jgi:hypothetical protein
MVQVRYLEADGIALGPQKGAVAELAALEDTVRTRMADAALHAYGLDDWSLAVELTSHLCLPDGPGEVAVQFSVQVCGSFSRKLLAAAMRSAFRRRHTILHLSC